MNSLPRLAQSSDKKDILNFCQYTFSWGDYIHEVWDNWIIEGNLENSTITCGWHAAQFSCETGKMEKFPAKINDLKSYTVVVESEDVFIEI